MKKKFIVFIILISALRVSAQQLPISQKITDFIVNNEVDSVSNQIPVNKGIILQGIDAVWKTNAIGSYFYYQKKQIDLLINKEGKFTNNHQSGSQINNVIIGRTLLTLYKVTLNPTYFKAATLLWQQLQKQPRNKEGVFGYSNTYPVKMQLDVFYRIMPFYAEYASLINDKNAFDDIANQFILIEKNTRDAKTGLLYHEWDEHKTVHKLPNFRARSMGWYAMSLVDVLDYFPKNHPQRKKLQAILLRTVNTIVNTQNSKTGLWYAVLNKPTQKGNYLELSAANMFVYTLAKGIFHHYLPSKFLVNAQKAYHGIKVSFAKVNNNPNFESIFSVSNLYKLADNENIHMLTIGTFLLASAEIERVQLPKIGKGKVVLLDSYYNNEFMKDLTGNQVSFHYKWEERSNNGYSFFGDLFKNNGFKLATLYQKPTSDNLKQASVYIIVDPDTEKETSKPNYIEPKDGIEISKWVKKGGVLVLMGNDAGNCELEKFNSLSEKFGIHFNGDTRGRVPIDNQYELGKIKINERNEIFKTAKNLFIKEYSSLSLSGNAKSLLVDHKDEAIAMAYSTYGKGTVLVIGDPWLYNEYTDGKKLPAEYDNFKGAIDLIKWLATKIN